MASDSLLGRVASNTTGNAGLLGTVGGLLHNVTRLLVSGPGSSEPQQLLTGLSGALLFGQAGLLGQLLDGSLIGSNGSLGLSDLLGTRSSSSGSSLGGGLLGGVLGGSSGGLLGGSGLLGDLLGGSGGLFAASSGAQASTTGTPSGTLATSISAGDPLSGLLGGVLSLL